MSSLLTEITPLSEKDCFYIVERHKSEFLFPLHRHRDYELNFIENGRGVRRVVGDSVEEIGDYELTLVAGESLVHAWEQGSCTYPDVREITIQFAPELFSPELLGKNQFSSIRKMLARAEHGLTFSLKTIMKVYSMLDILASQTERFEQFQCLGYIAFFHQLDGIVKQHDAGFEGYVEVLQLYHAVAHGGGADKPAV